MGGVIVDFVIIMHSQSEKESTSCTLILPRLVRRASLSTNHFPKPLKSLEGRSDLTTVVRLPVSRWMMSRQSMNADSATELFSICRPRLQGASMKRSTSTVPARIHVCLFHLPPETLANIFVRGARDYHELNSNDKLFVSPIGSMPRTFAVVGATSP